jgi:hypothetical protein
MEKNLHIRSEGTYAPMILDDMEVLAALIRPSLPIVSTLTERFSVMYLHASLLARRKPLMMEVGWILCLTSSLALCANDAALNRIRRAAGWNDEIQARV